VNNCLTVKSTNGIQTENAQKKPQMVCECSLTFLSLMHYRN